MAGMTRMDIGFFFIILLISVVHTNARNVFVFRSTGELTFLENGLIEKSTILDTVSEGEALALEKFPLDLFCNSCLEASRKVEKFLTDPSFLDKIGAICTDVCNLLPSDSQVKCLEMSEKYIHQTVLYLQEYFSESNLCHSTGLCPESTGFVVPDTIEENQASNERSCTTCRNAVKELQDDLEDPETKIKVIKVLLKACENVDGHVKECKKMVFDYGPLILANLGKYLSNNDVCYIVHVCDAAAYHADENTKLIELPVDGHLTAQPAKMIM